MEERAAPECPFIVPPSSLLRAALLQGRHNSGTPDGGQGRGTLRKHPKHCKKFQESAMTSTPPIAFA